METRKRENQKKNKLKRAKKKKGNDPCTVRKSSILTFAVAISQMEKLFLGMGLAHSSRVIKIDRPTAYCIREFP